MTPQREVATELLKRFPEAATMTLARIAVRESPSLFLTLESARTLFRRLRGASGESGRKKILDKSYFRPPGKPGDPFSAIPEGLQHFEEEWASVQLGGPRQVLLLADVHIPYHDKRALTAALNYGSDHEADTILLNGDISDCFSVSFWEKDPRKRDFAGEVESVRGFLGIVRRGFPKAEIIYKLGNHEERFERYMSVKAPELLGMDEFSLEKIFHFEEFGIRKVGDKRPIKLGKLNVVHGHEYKFSIQNPVNPARGYFLRAKTHCLGSHLHQASQHTEKNIEGKLISTWSTGCLCDMHPDYSPINNWGHGFAFIDVAKGGEFSVRNLKMIDGKIL